MQTNGLWFPEKFHALAPATPIMEAHYLRHVAPEGFFDPSLSTTLVEGMDTAQSVLLLGLDHRDVPWVHHPIDIFEFSHPVLEWLTHQHPAARIHDLAQHLPRAAAYELVIVGKALLTGYPGILTLALRSVAPGGRIVLPHRDAALNPPPGFLLQSDGLTWTRHRIRMMVVAPALVQGGADKALVDLLQTLDKERFAVTLVTTEPSPNPWIPLVQEHVLEHWDLGSMLQASPQRVRMLVDLAVRRAIDLVYVMHSQVGFDALPLIKAKTRAKTIAQFHLEEPGGGWIRYATSHYQNLIDHYAVITDRLKDYITGNFYVESHKVSVIHLGVRHLPDFMEPVPQNGLRILFPARLHEQKAPMRLIPIAESLRQAGVAAQIHVVGSGPLENALCASIRQAKLEDWIHLEGAVSPDAMEAWYRNTETVLLTSDYEGLPLAIIEGLAHGKPIVTSSVGAIAELVSPSVGFMIEQPNNIAGYVEALSTLARSPQLRNQMGSAARATIADGWLWQKSLDHYEALFLRLLEL